MTHITFHTVVKYRSNGQPLKLLTSRSTRLLVMFGALVVSCTKFGALVSNHLLIVLIERFGLENNNLKNCYKMCNYFLDQAVALIEGGYRLPPPPGCSNLLYKAMVECW